MEEQVLKVAIAAVASDEYSDGDIRIIKAHISRLNKEEATIKREMEKEALQFVRNKGKNQNKLKHIRNSIKELKHILKAV